VFFVLALTVSFAYEEDNPLDRPGST